MRPEEILITRDPRLLESLQRIRDGRLKLLQRWPAREQMPQRLLIVDVAAMSPSEWIHMERWSRQSERASLVLVDDGMVSRERLVRIFADALVPADATDAQMRQRIEAYLWDHPFRIAAQTIRRAALPHPLGKFLAAAFTAKCRKVSTLARSLGMSESTLRNQWGRWRSDGSLRLEDLLKQIDDVRQTAIPCDNPSIDRALDSVLEAMSGTKRARST